MQTLQLQNTVLVVGSSSPSNQREHSPVIEYCKTIIFDYSLQTYKVDAIRSSPIASDP